MDLSSCDNEPIHLLGKIQSHGCLLAFDRQTHMLNYASVNAGEFFKNIPFSNTVHLHTFLGDDAFQFVQQLPSKQFYNELYPQKLTINNETYRCYFANAGNYLIAEFEKEADGAVDFALFNQFNIVASAIRNATTSDVLFATVVHALKERFGFDRVMMYIFDELGDGEVVAEEKEPGLESFLGLRYPASDIPKQARLLYLTNISRAVNDVNDEGISIKCYQSTPEELDLSYSVFRSVSPVHIQYLKNMGVTATHAISLIIQNKLWGMIIFHNYSGPKCIDFNGRLIAQILTMNTAQALELIEAKKGNENSDIQKKLLDKIRFSDESQYISELIFNHWLSISKQLKSCGFTVLEDNLVESSYGTTPNNEQIEVLHKWVIENHPSQPITYSNGINEIMVNWGDEEIAGYLSVAITPSKGKFIYLWRKAKIQTINWAGNPEKSIQVSQINQVQVLTPRSSFALWQQKVSGKSLPWNEYDIAFASKLSDTIIALEIEKYSELIIKNNQLQNSQSTLEGLLVQKSEELYKLNLQLHEELKENKKYQRELEVAKTAGEQLNKLKTHFISNISHEVRTPINGIIGLAQLITSDPGSLEEVQTFGNLILDCSKRLLGTVNRILTVSRIENKEIKVIFEKTDIVDFVQQLLMPLKVLANEKEQILVLNVHNEHFTIVTDKHYFGQIFTNLVSNAIKYTPNQGYIEINIKRLVQNNQQQLILLVEDNGIGIESKVVDKIFDPFFTENEVSKQSDNSSGLGLYLVKNYLEYLEGEIKVKSEKGKGTQFTVNIPIHQ